MWTLSAGAATTLRSSHTITARCTAFSPTGTVYPGIPLEGGSVTADAKSQVRRTATITVADPRLWPAGGFDVLSPVGGAELLVEFGIIVPGKGTEWIPLIRGPVQSVARAYPNTDALSVDIADRSKTVAENRMDSPTQTIAAATVVSEITRLIQETLSVNVIDETGDTTVAPLTDINRERWQDGVEALADSIGAEVFADAAGDFHIRYQPTVDDTPVWVVDAGVTGVLIKAELELTRDQVYNAVIASGERGDGTAPVWAKVTDTDPDSPTYYGGPFGKKPRYYSSPLITAQPQAITAAQAMLDRVRGYGCTVTISTVPNPALEPGDVLDVLLPDGTRQRHIIDKVPVDLGASATQDLTTRSIDLPAES